MKLLVLSSFLVAQRSELGLYPIRNTALDQANINAAGLETPPLAKLRNTGALANYAVSILELQKVSPFDEADKTDTLPNRMTGRGSVFYEKVLATVPQESKDSIRQEIIALQKDIPNAQISDEDQEALNAFASNIGSSYGLTKESLWQRFKSRLFVKTPEQKRPAHEPTIPIDLTRSAVTEAEQLLSEIHYRRTEALELDEREKRINRLKKTNLRII